MPHSSGDLPATLLEIVHQLLGNRGQHRHLDETHRGALDVLEAHVFEVHAELTDLGGGLSWDTSNLGTTGTIEVVPEPGTYDFINRQVNSSTGTLITPIAASAALAAAARASTICCSAGRCPR